MEFTDRMMAIDRSVAQYRRFAHNDLAEAAPDMLVDLLHWHARFCDRDYSVETAHDMLLTALESFLTEFKDEKEAEQPLRGVRRAREPQHPRHQYPGDPEVVFSGITGPDTTDDRVMYDPTRLSPPTSVERETLSEAFRLLWEPMPDETPPVIEEDEIEF